MRKLNTGDVFAALRVVKKLDIQGKLKDIALEAEKNEKIDISKVGADVMEVILDRMCDEAAEKEIYRLLARPLEVAPDEVESMDLLEMLSKLKDIADIKGWQAFLSHAVSLM